MIIYKITNLINGKSYIGQTTKSIELRWKQHKKDMYKLDFYFYRALKKYGIGNFLIEQIDFTDTIDKLNKLEEKYIKELNTISPNGYNLSSGGKNKKHHPESIIKISKSKIGQRKGVKFTEKHKLNLSISLKGKNKSEETKKRMSKSKMGKKWSEDNKKKLSIAHTGKKHSPETLLKIGISHCKKIMCLNNGQFYNSIKDAAYLLNLNSSKISMVCNGKRKTTGGLSFCFI